MKQVVSLSLFLALTFSLLFLTSCEKDEVLSIKLSKASLELNVGTTDTLKVTLVVNGDMDKIKFTPLVVDTNIVKIVSEEIGAVTASSSGNSMEKILVLKAKKEGTTKIRFSADGKTVDCEVKVIMRNLLFTKILASNWGDYYDIGTNNFDMIMYENTMSINTAGKLTGDGNYIYIEFNVPITQNAFNNGDFSVSEEGDANTFLPGAEIESGGNTYVLGTRIVNVKAGKNTISLIKGGSYKITTNESGFKIEGDLIDENDGVIHFMFNGIVALSDKRDAAEVKPALTHGLLYYFGDDYQTGKSNSFTMYLASATLNFKDTTTKGDILALEINTALTAKDSIPNGTYNMITELTTANLVPFTLIPAYITENNNEYGTWFYGEDTTKKIKLGSITSQKTGSNYAISYELYDRFGAKVSGAYNGELEFTDATKKSGIGASKIIGKKKIAAKLACEVSRKLRVKPSL